MQQQDERSEVIERATLLSLHEHCPASTREELGLFMVEVGDALVAGASNDPSILLNRVLGMGTNGPVSRAHIEAVHAEYVKHGVARYFLHVYPDSLSDGAATFDETPLDKTRGWMKFHRDMSPPLVRDTDLRIEQVGEEGAAHFGRIVASAFGMSEAAGPLLAGLVHDPRWHLFVSYDGDSPAGAGSLFVEDGAGWFEWGATDTAFRRRGSQGAIMTARIRRAIELGCTAMFTETGEAVEGDPQHSYSNIERYGFKPTLLRENWAPPRA